MSLGQAATSEDGRALSAECQEGGGPPPVVMGIQPSGIQGDSRVRTSHSSSHFYCSVHAAQPLPWVEGLRVVPGGLCWAGEGCAAEELSSPNEVLRKVQGHPHWWLHFQLLLHLSLHVLSHLIFYEHARGEATSLKAKRYPCQLFGFKSLDYCSDT